MHICVYNPLTFTLNTPTSTFYIYRNYSKPSAREMHSTSEGNVCIFANWPFDRTPKGFLVTEIQIQHNTLQAHSRRASVIIADWDENF